MALSLILAGVFALVGVLISGSTTYTVILVLPVIVVVGVLQGCARALMVTSLGLPVISSFEYLVVALVGSSLCGWSLDAVAILAASKAPGTTLPAMTAVWTLIVPVLLVLLGISLVVGIVNYVVSLGPLGHKSSALLELTLVVRVGVATLLCVIAYAYLFNALGAAYRALL